MNSKEKECEGLPELCLDDIVIDELLTIEGVYISPEIRTKMDTAINTEIEKEKAESTPSADHKKKSNIADIARIKLTKKLFRAKGDDDYDDEVPTIDRIDGLSNGSESENKLNKAERKG